MARLVLLESSGSVVDRVVEHTFADQVRLPWSSTELDGHTAVVSHSAIPQWAEMEGLAVIRAEQEIDGTIQWLWATPDVVWIVRGSGGTEDYVRAVLRTYVDSIDPWDQQGMNGNLYFTPDVPGYAYLDFPRVDTLGEIPHSLLNPCVERFYVGYVRTEDASNTEPYVPEDLVLSLAKAAGACVDFGSLDLFAEDIANIPGAQPVEIAGFTAYRNEVSISVLDDDVLITFVSQSPETFVDMEPFITEFLANQDF